MGSFRREGTQRSSHSRVRLGEMTSHSTSRLKVARQHKGGWPEPEWHLQPAAFKPAVLRQIVRYGGARVLRHGHERRRMDATADANRRQF